MHQAVLQFWFEQLTPPRWFAVDPALDALIAERFAPQVAQARAGELWSWRSTAQGRLAEILLIDQLSRNLYRGKPEAFSADAVALVLAQEAVSLGVDQQLPPAQRAFLYMPYMHSESAAIHEEAMRLFDQPGLEHNLAFERQHKAIIDRFGRYPHRNATLGRVSTDEELAFLQQPGSSF